MLSFRFALALFIALSLAVAAGAQPSVITISADGTTRDILLVPPTGKPAAVVVMFPGGDGVIGIGPQGSIARQGNFLIRTRDLWLARGLMFVAVDGARGQAGMKGDRVGPASQHAIAEIARQIRARTPAPIWLLGTSAGAPQAMAGAASLPAGSIRGVAISSPISTPGPRDSVFDVSLGRITVPTLIQVNREDSCASTPPVNAARIRAALTASPAATVQEFSGGSPPRSGPCEAFSRHGFLGIEPQVVNAAADFILSH